MLRPGMRLPAQPLSMGLSFILRNLVIESLSFINLSILKCKALPYSISTELNLYLTCYNVDYIITRKNQ